jgi:hypothetical protein
VNGTLNLVAVNGAALSTLYPATSDCSHIAYGDDRIPVVGLVPGVDFCVRTNRGFVAHVFFTDDIENQTATVPIWYVTRRND